MKRMTFEVKKVLATRNERIAYLMLKTKRGKIPLYITLVAPFIYWQDVGTRLGIHESILKIDMDDETINGKAIIGKTIDLTVSLVREFYNGKVVVKWAMS